jgi:alkylhydroperoxidase/carboxymuconolactone decarboxylase family protein YurZ
MEDNTNKIIYNLDNLKKESPEYFELIDLFKRALKHISDLDSKVKDLINIVLSMSGQSSDFIKRNIETAFHDGVRRDDIIAAACLALIQLDRSDKSVIKPLIESISKYDPVTNFRSDCYWYDN